MDELLRRLKRIFLVELDERVDALNRDLLALEGDPPEAERATLLSSLFRSAHSLKGAAGSVEIGLIETACHHLEDFFTAGLEQRVALDPGVIDLLLTAVDAIQDAGSRLRQDQEIEQGPLRALLPRLTDMASLASAGGAPHQPNGSRPAATPVETGSALAGPLSAGPLSAGPSGAAPLSAARVAAECETPSSAAPPPALPPAPLPAPPLAPPASETGAGRDSALVRVAADKLDTLLARSGELMVASRRAATRDGELAELRLLVRRWRADWLRADRLRGPRAGAPHRSPAATDPRLAGRPPAGTSALGTSALGTSVPGPPLLGTSVPGTPAPSLARDPAPAFLRRLDRELERFGAALLADRAMLGQAVGAIDAEIRRARMQPLSEACLGLDRTVRDLARAGGKTVQLVLAGGEVELDRSVLDGLKDPLLHLVRNAVDHGIERPEQRQAAGKPARGEIRLTAALHGNMVEITVADDGAGLNLPAIREHAHRRGQPDAEDAQIARCIFLPGFSTSEAVTRLSGRGVGLDAVRSQVERMRGTVDVASEPGKGTRFSLRVPLTLTTLHALLVRAGSETFALDSAGIVALRRVARETLRPVGGRDMLPIDGRLLPVVPLASLLGLEAGTEQETDAKSTGPEAGAKLIVVLLGVAEPEAALVVDALLDEQELVVRSLGSRLAHVRHIAGATILASGRIALILNGAELAATARDLGAARSLTAFSPETEAPARRRLLLVEDFLTTRTLERSILESAGYDVTAVSDGLDAWSALQQGGIDLVVSDVDMPRMDGFALTETIRATPRFHALPVVLVTARETDDEKARGLAAGADAYLIKSGFDQTVLIDTIGQLL